jgi:hypothetical protein
MDLFVTLNVATFKNILHIKNVYVIMLLIYPSTYYVCIPVVGKYFIFVVSMEIREKNQSHVLLGNGGNNEENNCNYYATG